MTAVLVTRPAKRWPHLLKRPLDIRLQRWETVLDGEPNDVEVDAVVRVSKPIAMPRMSFQG